MAVRAYHVIFGTYGFWLPNDPRGSWSDFVGAWELYLQGGRATKTNERRSAAGDLHDQTKRLATKEFLKYPEVRLSGLQAKCVAEAFGETARHMGCLVFACSILPQHVHLVLGRSHHKAETVVKNLKASATKLLIERAIHPLANVAVDGKTPPTMWAKGCWKVFMTDGTTIVEAIEYVENNPVKEGKPLQTWKFVTKWVDV